MNAISEIFLINISDKNSNSTIKSSPLQCENKGLISDFQRNSRPRSFKNEEVERGMDNIKEDSGISTSGPSGVWSLGLIPTNL